MISKYRITGQFFQPAEETKGMNIWDYLPDGAAELRFETPGNAVDWAIENSKGPDPDGIAPSWAAVRATSLTEFLTQDDAYRVFVLPGYGAVRDDSPERAIQRAAATLREEYGLTDDQILEDLQEELAERLNQSR